MNGDIIFYSIFTTYIVVLLALSGRILYWYGYEVNRNGNISLWAKHHLDEKMTFYFALAFIWPLALIASPFWLGGRYLLEKGKGKALREQELRQELKHELAQARMQLKASESGSTEREIFESRVKFLSELVHPG